MLNWIQNFCTEFLGKNNGLYFLSIYLKSFKMFSTWNIYFNRAQLETILLSTTHFMPAVSFYTPWKHFKGINKKTNGMKWVKNTGQYSKKKCNYWERSSFLQIPIFPEQKMIYQINSGNSFRYNKFSFCQPLKGKFKLEETQKLPL